MAKGAGLAFDIYKIFGFSKDFGFRDQICRAAVSVSNNIAEGFERRTDADFSRFLYIASGSCSEVKSMLYLAEKLGYIKAEEKENLIFKCTETSKIIKGLIKSLTVKQS